MKINWGYLIFMIILAIGIGALINFLRKRLSDADYMYVLITKITYPIVLAQRLGKRIKRWWIYVPLKRFVIAVGWLRVGLQRTVWRLDKFIDWYAKLLMRYEEEKEEGK